MRENHNNGAKGTPPSTYARTRHRSAISSAEKRTSQRLLGSNPLLSPITAKNKYTNISGNSPRCSSAGSTSRSRSRTLVVSNSDNNLLPLNQTPSPTGTPSRPLPESPLPQFNQNSNNHQHHNGGAVVFGHSPSPTESTKSSHSQKEGTSTPAKHFKSNLNQIHPRSMKHIRLDGHPDVEKLYRIHQDPIGKGSYGTVYKASDRSKASREWLWAIKKITKEMAGTGGVGLLEREVSILKRVTHPNIIYLEAVYETQKHMYLVTELCVEGELKAYLKRRKTIPEPETRVIIRQLSSALTYLHRYGVVHRDIKLENILVKQSNESVLSRATSTTTCATSLVFDQTNLPDNAGPNNERASRPATSLLPRVQKSNISTTSSERENAVSRGGKEVSNRRTSLQPFIIRPQFGAPSKRDRHQSTPSAPPNAGPPAFGRQKTGTSQTDVEVSPNLESEDPSRVAISDIEIKLTDFGLAVVRGGVSSVSMLMTFCGTPVYMAPEVIQNHDYSQTCDVWSMGVIAYTLISGKYPWLIQPGHEVEDNLYNQIKRGKPISEYDSCFSQNAIQCISGMLEVNTARRLTAAEVLNHPWTQGIEKEAPKNLWDAMKEAAKEVRDSQSSKVYNSPVSRPSSTSSTKR